MRKAGYFCVILAAFLLVALPSPAAMKLRGELKALKPPQGEDSCTEEREKEVEIFLDHDLPGGGKASLPVTVWRTDHADLLYTMLLDEDMQAVGLAKPALLIFDLEGAFKAEVPGVDPESCWTISASPKGDILAVDQGSSHRRAWLFFSYPGLDPVGKPLAYVNTGQSGSGMIWVDDDTVVADDMAEPENAAARAARCGDQQTCGIRSVYMHKIRAGVRTPVFQGTPLCDYRWTTVENGRVRAEKLCVKKSSDWRDLPEDSLRLEEVEAPLPAAAPFP